MLNAWHLPVAPFVKQHNDKLTITLWLSGENPPSRVTLRSEFDNEEISLAMRKQRRQPQPGVTAWRATLNIALGQPRRRYSFKLLWHDRQLWFTPQGFSRFPPARLEQFAVDVPDSGPQWVADQIFYQIFPDRFARSQSREAGQDRVYYHHAAGQEIVLRDWDDPLTPQAGGSTFYGGCLNGICEKLPYLKKLGVTALYLNPVFTAPSVHKYDTEDYRHVDPQFGGDRALLRLRRKTQVQGMRLVLDGVFNHSGDSHVWFDRHNRSTGGACHHPDSPWRDWYSFSPQGVALDWLFTWPGVPCIYYGDEVGVDGANDPMCRKPFPWDERKQDGNLLALYQRMAKLRQSSLALRRGGCQALYAEGDVVVFVRVYQQQRALVAINRGEACEVALEALPLLNVAGWQCKTGSGDIREGRLSLPAISATVWMNR